APPAHRGAVTGMDVDEGSHRPPRTPRPQAPLGVFDSGLGGLTVVRALRERCPQEDIVYLGDTARVPYGTRSPETIIRYALGCTHYPLLRGAIEAEAADLAGEPIAIVDSAQATAAEVGGFLADRGYAARRDRRGSLDLLVTDLPKSFAAVAERFLGEPAAHV